MGAWLIVKAAIGWGDLVDKAHEGRVHYSVTLFGSMV